MARSALGARMTCESCPSIDVREWQRKGLLRAGQEFSWSWRRGGDAAGSITVRVEEEILTSAGLIDLQALPAPSGGIVKRPKRSVDHAGIKGQ
jgi:hypothetical protein